MTIFLGIDIGTSSSKGVLARADGTVLARAERAHGVSTPHPGWVEHDAETVWWADFVAISRDLVAAAAAHGPIAGLAVSGIGPCLLPADAAGNPLRPAILYGVDTRASTEIAELNTELDDGAVLARAGSPLTSQAVGPKLRWLQRHEPQVYADTRMFLMASSFLVHRLTGRYVLDHQSASQCVPMYDLHEQRWSDWAEVVAPGLALPELAWPTEIVGHVTRDAAAATGLPDGLPVTTGTIDAWAEAASVGVRAPGDAMIMYGTTMFLVQVLTRPQPHPGLWGTCGTWPGTYTLAAGMATSGAVTDWLRQLVGGDFTDLVTEAAAVPPGSRGLLTLPYFAGERTPLFDPDARGIIAGLTLRHGRAELYRAVLEGIAYGVRHNLAAMTEAGGQANRLVAVGGGTKGGLWTRIVSDVTGLPQQLPAETIGACLGDALLAAEAAGVDTAGWNPPIETVAPDPDRTAHYLAYYERYRMLYDATRDITHFLAAMNNND